LTKRQVAEIYWRAKAWSAEITMPPGSIPTSGSLSATGQYQTPNYNAQGYPDGTYTTHTETVSASVGVDSLSEFRNAEFTCQVYQSVDPSDPSQGVRCESGITDKGSTPLSDTYRKRKLVTISPDYSTEANEKFLIANPSTGPFGWESKQFKKNNDDFFDSSWAAFLNRDAIRKQEVSQNNAASVSVDFYSDPERTSFISPVAYGLNQYVNNFGVIGTPGFSPVFDFIKVSEDEYWWSPGFKLAVSFNIYAQASSTILEGEGGDSGVGIEINDIPPGGSFISNPEGMEVKKFPISLTFSNGDTASGEHFFILQSRAGKLADGLTAGSSASDASESGTTSVSLAVDTSLFVPESVSLTIAKYWPYEGLYDEATGLPSG
jgi:hypothetical protein